MRKTSGLSLTFLIATLMASTALAQVKTPRPSPQASLTQTVGLTDVTIKYSRPGVKGRTIWGDLVPYGQVWRTGANEATTITFSDDVTVGGKKLPKGTYSLHTTPGQDAWTIHFNSVADQWGSYSYDAANDVVSVTAKPERAPFREWLTFEIPEMTTDTAKVVIRWENVAVPFTIDTDSRARTMAALKAAMAPSWMTAYQAANFAFENPGVATDAEMNAWLEQSIGVSPTIANLYLKARIAQRAGNRADAVRYGEMAIAAATPQQKAFADFVRGEVDKWKK